MGHDEEHEWKPEDKSYMKTAWWAFLPFYIFVAMIILSLLLGFISGVNTFASTSSTVWYFVVVILWGLLLYWLCDIGSLTLAWWLVLLPVILALATSVVTMGVAYGNSMSGRVVSKNYKPAEE
jgi:hypothetical protein